MSAANFLISQMVRVRQRRILFVGAALLGGLLTTSANAQYRSEMRDPVRGVSFHSMELSDQAINDLHVLEGTFSDNDRLTLGVSARVFDGATEIDPYIFWIRHEGREWLDHALANSVQVVADETPLIFGQMRSPQRFTGAGDLVYEKLEFVLAADELSRLLNAERASISVRSNNGTVEKRILPEELERIRALNDSIDSSLLRGKIQ